MLVIKARNNEAESALRLPSNEKYSLHRDLEHVSQHRLGDDRGSPFLAPSHPNYALSLTQRPINPVDGWVFGSDEKYCDIQLASGKETGISSRHFRVNDNQTSGHLLLVDVSQHYTVMSYPRFGEVIVVQESRVILPTETIITTAGFVVILLQILSREKHQDAFDGALSLYLDEVQAAEPRLFTLSSGMPSQGEDPKETPLGVLGKLNRAQYLIEKEGDIGRGAFGTVSKARFIRSQEIPHGASNGSQRNRIALAYHLCESFSYASFSGLHFIRSTLSGSLTSRKTQGC